MATQTRKARTAEKRETEVVEEETAAPVREDSSAVTEGLLDEIDDMLAEVDAAQFVADYKQKGGE